MSTQIMTSHAKTENLHIRVPYRLMEDLRAHSARTGVPYAETVRRAVEEKLKRVRARK